MEDLVDVTKAHGAAEEQNRANHVEKDAKHASDQYDADKEQPGADDSADCTVDGALVGLHLHGSFFELRLYRWQHEPPQGTTSAAVPERPLADRLVDCTAPLFSRYAQLDMQEGLDLSAQPFQVIVVARDGLEPPTRGFSVPCSTN